jgi:hypothetical protein
MVILFKSAVWKRISNLNTGLPKALSCHRSWLAPARGAATQALRGLSGAAEGRGHADPAPAARPQARPSRRSRRRRGQRRRGPRRRGNEGAGGVKNGRGPSEQRRQERPWARAFKRRQRASRTAVGPASSGVKLASKTAMGRSTQPSKRSVVRDRTHPDADLRRSVVQGRIDDTLCVHTKTRGPLKRARKDT